MAPTKKATKKQGNLFSFFSKKSSLKKTIAAALSKQTSAAAADATTTHNNKPKVVKIQTNFFSGDDDKLKDSGVVEGCTIVVYRPDDGT